MSRLMRAISLHHVEDVAYWFFPDQVPLHRTCGHVLNYVLDRGLSAGVDVFVAGHRWAGERVAALPVEALAVQDRVTFPLHDVIQRVRVVTVRDDVLARIDP